MNRPKLATFLNLYLSEIAFMILGQSPRRLIAGFMMTTMFLSMWISNTAATAMMVPIVHAILQELYKVICLRKIVVSLREIKLYTNFKIILKMNIVEAILKYGL